MSWWMTSRYLINDKCNFTRITNNKLIEIKYAFDIKYDIKYKLDIPIFINTNYIAYWSFNHIYTMTNYPKGSTSLWPIVDRQKLCTDTKQQKMRYSLLIVVYVIFAEYLKFLARYTAAVRHVVPCVSFIKASRSVSRALLDPNSNPGLEVERFDLTLTRSHWTMLLLSNCCCYSIKHVELWIAFFFSIFHLFFFSFSFFPWID